MNTKLLALVTATLPLAAIAQISYSGGIYTQDFDTLRSGTIYAPYTNFPTGWTVSSTYNSGTYVWTTVTNGYSNNYGEYCFSLTASDPDKSVGLVIGSTGPAYLGARFRNTSGVTLTAFTLSYFAEQWRKGASFLERPDHSIFLQPGRQQSDVWDVRECACTGHAQHS